MIKFKSLKSKFLAYIISTLFVVFVIVTIILSNIIANKSTKGSENKFKGSAEHIAIAFNTLDNNLHEVMNGYLNVIKTYLPDSYSIDKEKIVKVGQIAAPAFYNGSTLLNNNFEPLEKYTQTTGVIATVFARMGNDFVRVTTTLKKENGSRAFGTMLGQNSPAMKSMLEGKTFYGKVKLFGKDYYVVYEPILRDNKVIGILFIGYDFTSALGSLKKEIKEIKINNDGYAFMMDNKGNLIIHPTNEGKNLFDIKDNKGNFTFKDMVKGEDRLVKYTSTNNVDKIAYVKHLKGFNAILVVSDTIDDVYSFSKEATIYISIAFIITLIIISVLLLIVTSKVVANPLEKLNIGLLDFFKYINKESKDVKLLEIKGEDEFAKMSEAINKNINKTSSLIKEDAKLIEEVKTVVNSAKNGDLSKRVKVSTSNGSLEELKEIFNEMLNVTSTNVCQDVNQLKDVLLQYKNFNFIPRIKNDSGLVAIGLNELAEIINEMLVENKSIGLKLDNSSKELLDNMRKLNNSTNDAAASLEETSAAIEEITGNVRQNSENISKMSSLTKHVLGSANDGQKLANETTTSMDEINEQVKAISEAILSIDNIAFQTNILSLNAAVEAATAGEAGKGFAVVAGEVRNLANRSSEVAKEIKTIVENATHKADNGKDIASKMIAGYVNLNENISQTINLIADIEMASKEQLQGIEQINDAVNSLDKQTQQNAVIANRTNAIAEESDHISKIVLKNADEKEFIGKSEVTQNSYEV
ncbi:methyl-accepting chemotaxis sensory transducer with Cache sensor [Arcobacter nitrofigilis DSM 7299]|uniref:Methyl-accepting chemotaxis sensory transducer with Cache sensor n=1 Tax=Arcobacter nitrofigilis (strain ATCC 33309 / DSM 7299 / CCUG 15893 / LMG 7604 / NCTC 12251 / CI) TaxID=572480 RepID=D5V2F9_ARCNC|nr:methyl-accepting chemotaxis protein [Arcobacter nitrofigilis]ADG92392.1 methyl-accepting chemotaxis sensory transducer with Cache sensor [Arcobacter nitrofigilis DSM 7299]